MRREKGSHVGVVGCGAIGSFLAMLLARLIGVAHITLVDPGAYEESNLHSQNIFPCDVNQLKVGALARRLRSANPALEVTAIPSAVEDVPPGRLRADLIVACTDSLRSRQTINQLAWCLRTPWIDTGVLESEKLARVNVYVAAADSPCWECAMSDDDYKLLEAEYPCGAGGEAERPSDTSAALASLAASLAAIECHKMLTGDASFAAVGRQVTADVRTHRMLSTSFRRNPSCRFDHASWDLVPLRCSLHRFTVADALAVTGRLQVAGHRFARQMACPICGLRLDGLRLNRPKARCLKCGARMITPGFDGLLTELDATLPEQHMTRSLAQVGLRSGDVICGTDKQFELLGEGR